MLLASAVPESVSVLSLVMSIAHRAAVGRERGDRRRHRRNRIDGDSKRSRGHAGIAGDIGGGGGEAVGAIGERRRGVAPGAGAARGRRCRAAWRRHRS